MRFRKNRLQFGKLFMNDTDLTMIDMDPADPFDFFLDHYPDQIAKGYTKITSSFSLLVYTKDYDKLRVAAARQPGDVNGAKGAAKSGGTNPEQRDNK